jgi:hypothetical protein
MDCKETIKEWTGVSKLSCALLRLYEMIDRGRKTSEKSVVAKSSTQPM